MHFQVLFGFKTDPRGYDMFRYALFIGLMLPACASAADYIVYSGEKRHCPMDQAGNQYCIDAPPVEKLITDCDPGVDCHHMQSGQHYSLQSPLRGE